MKEHFSLNQEFWNKWGYPSREHADARYISHLVLELFIQEGPLLVRKRVFLHPLDYNNPRHLADLRQRIKVPLNGVFITGASIPKEIELIVHAMASGSIFVLELFKQHESILDRLSLHGETEIFSPHLTDYKAEEVRFSHFQKH